MNLPVFAPVCEKVAVGPKETVSFGATGRTSTGWSVYCCCLTLKKLLEANYSVSLPVP